MPRSDDLFLSGCVEKTSNSFSHEGSPVRRNMVDLF